MHWTTKTLIWGAGLLAAAYPLLFVGVVLLFVWHGFATELPRQLADIGRGEADATVVDVRTRCRIREIYSNGSHRRNVNVEVPCDRVEAEIAARSVPVQRLSPIDDVRISFATDRGEPVEAIGRPGLLGLQDPIMPGQFVRTSYDRANPAHQPRKARGNGALFALAVILTLLAAVLIAVWRWMRRRWVAFAARRGRA